MSPVDDAYKAAGVDIAAGNEAVARYREIAAVYRHPSVISGIGGFSGLFALPGDDRRALVASTDGVGTKVLIASEVGRFGTVGADLVNHCVNDILVTTAKPLFFLDYLAVGKLDPDIAASIVSGVNEACRAHEMALLGGETAEMPDLYDAGDFDLAGTIVGVVEVARVPDHARVAGGDVIVGLPSVGLHTNGYSLARRVIAANELSAAFNGATFADALLAEHPSYERTVRKILAVADVKAMAHITGGGLRENVPRTLPVGMRAVFDQSLWNVPPIFEELIRRAKLSYEERYRVFNMGIGYTLVVPPQDVDAVLAAAPEARVVGTVEPRRENDPDVAVRPARP